MINRVQRRRILGVPRPRTHDSGTLATHLVHSTALQPCNNTVLSKADLPRVSSVTQSHLPCDHTCQSRAELARLNQWTGSLWKVASSKSNTSTLGAPCNSATTFLNIESLIFCVPIPTTTTKGIVRHLSIILSFFLFNNPNKRPQHRIISTSNSGRTQGVR